MSKTNNTHLLMSAGAIIIIGIIVMLKREPNHNSGVCESAGKNFDEKLKEFSAVLNKATRFVQHTLNFAP